MENARIIFRGKEYAPHTETNLLEFILKHNIKKAGLLLDRDYRMLNVIHTLFLNNIVYVPIDIQDSPQRIEFIIENAELDCIITKNEFSNKISVKKIICIDEYQHDERTDISMKSDDTTISYVLYTSGSTGTPKGVEVYKKGLENFIDGISELIDFSPCRRIACLTTYTFDIFFLESIMALQKGLTVVLGDEDEQKNPKRMAEFIRENRIDMLQMTPSRMQLLHNFDNDFSCLKDVQDILIGGEPFPANLLQELQQKTNARIYNMYGPVETTIWSTVGELTKKDKVDIGKAIKNTQIYILDKDLNILPAGQAGEICIAGDGLAKGYLKRDDLTTAAFINLPQSSGLRVYRTGDIGRFLPDGNLEYLGREDNQIKIRGHRVELEEIESVINLYEGILRSIVIAKIVNDAVAALHAFYTADREIDEAELKEYLKQKLSPHMVPAFYTMLAEFPYTSNGKIDRKALKADKAMHAEIQETADEQNTLSEIQQKVFTTIKSNVEKDLANDLTPDSDLTATGIDSITFINLLVAVMGAFDYSFEFEDDMLKFTAFPTIRSIMEYVEKRIMQQSKK